MLRTRNTQNHNEAQLCIRRAVWVKGRVLAVGFRAHLEYHARQISGLTGWVRNVGYDTVEAIAEGKRFIEMMKQGPRASRVDESKVEWENLTSEFQEFGVRRSV